MTGGASSTSINRRSEEHTSELQSPCNIVCRLLLEKTTPGRRRAPGPRLGGRAMTWWLIPLVMLGQTPDRPGPAESNAVHAWDSAVDSLRDVKSYEREDAVGIFGEATHCFEWARRHERETPDLD